MIRFEVDQDMQETRAQTGLMMMGESLCDGRFIITQHSLCGRPKFQGSVDPMGRSWVQPHIGFFPVEAFELEADGQSLHGHWQWERAGTEPCDSGVHGTVSLLHTVRPVRVRVHTKLDGTAFVERWLEIQNLGDQPMALSRVSPMSGLLWKINDRASHPAKPLFEVQMLPDVPFLYEGSFEKRTLQHGTTTFQNHYGRSGWGVPWFQVRNRASGETFIGHLEWSANWRIDFHMLEYAGGQETLLSFAAGPAGRAPLRMVAPGETVLSPVMHLGHVQGSISDCVEATHRHLRLVMPKLKSDQLLIGAGRVVDGDLEWLRGEAQLAVDAGLEYFVIDAGWFCRLGQNWYTTSGDWDVKSFGGTLTAVREMLHGMGLKFGLWMEPEAMGNESNIAKSHATEWSLCRDGKPIAEGRIMDLSRQDVLEYVTDQVIRTFSDHQMDLFKIDYNTFAIHEGGENLRDGYMENGTWRYVQALYGLFDGVREAFPNVILENCAGGGGRNDLGMLRRFHVAAISDYAVMPRSLKAINNLTMAYPPERLRIYFNHFPTYSHYGDTATHMRMLMLCNAIFVSCGRDLSWRNEDESSLFSKYVALYKNFCRKIMVDCTVYHHTPGLALDTDDPWCVLEYAKPDHSAGYICLFRMQEGAGELMLRPRGTDVGRAYTVTLMDRDTSFVMQGAQLMMGLPIRMEGALTSEMVLYEAVDPT